MYTSIAVAQETVDTKEAVLMQLEKYLEDNLHAFVVYEPPIKKWSL